MSELNFRRAAEIITELLHGGVGSFVISPGFRNSPLNLAAEMICPDRVVRILDERAAGFFALGRARAMGRPAALICTSGTAAANYFPAILEAESTHIPLVVVTADRPHSLVGTGANQTMDQWNLYGKHVRDFYSLVAGAGEAEFFLGLQTVARLSLLSLKAGGGPVHLNVEFSEPLLPKDPSDINKILASIESRNRPMVAASTIKPEEKFWTQSLAKIQGSRRAAILLSSYPYPENFLSGILALAKEREIPVWAEPGSGLFGLTASKASDFVFGDLGLLSTIPSEFSPELVIRFGPPPIHKSVEASLLAREGLSYWIVDFPGERRLPEPKPANFIESDSEHWLASARDLLGRLEFRSSRETLAWARTETKARREKILAAENEPEKISERSAWREILRSLEGASDLFIGNSMPIRDFNATAWTESASYRIFHNRGLSGIDGLIASALGVAYGSERPMTIVLGDLSAIYDMSSLLLAKLLMKNLSLRVVVLNNSGGDIFRAVGTKAYPEDVFVLPMGLDWVGLGRSLGVEASSVSDRSGMREWLQATKGYGAGLRLLEIKIDAETNRGARV